MGGFRVVLQVLRVRVVLQVLRVRVVLQVLRVRVVLQVLRVRVVLQVLRVRVVLQVLRVRVTPLPVHALTCYLRSPIAPIPPSPALFIGKTVRGWCLWCFVPHYIAFIHHCIFWHNTTIPHA